jgi:hypothetical protein
MHHHQGSGLKSEWGHPVNALAAAAYASYSHQGMQQIWGTTYLDNNNNNYKQKQQQTKTKTFRTCSTTNSTIRRTSFITSAATWTRINLYLKLVIVENMKTNRLQLDPLQFLRTPKNDLDQHQIRNISNVVLESKSY